MSPGDASEFCKILRHMRKCYPSRKPLRVTSPDACQKGMVLALYSQEVNMLCGKRLPRH